MVVGEVQNFSVERAAQLRNAKFMLLAFEREVLPSRLGDRSGLRISVRNRVHAPTRAVREVLMLQSCVRINPKVRVEVEQAAEQLECIR
jgi:hypothetical protein